MKISRYTLTFDVDNKEYYIYNTLSNALLEIDKPSFLTLKGSESIDPDSLDPELWDVLVDKRFVTENDDDDYLIYKSQVMNLRANDTSMHLTIAPTMDCCFSCHYCFEQHKNRAYMKSENIDAIIKYVTSVDTLRSIYVTWFGGEPLMAIDKIEEFYDKFSKVWEHKYDSNIITTGYHINEEIIRVLQKVKVSQVQITLDGDQQSHNAIKNFEGEDDAFTKTIDNIDLLTTLAPEINVTIRVNLLKENADTYVGLVRDLSKRFKGRNFGISPAFVKNKGVDKDKAVQSHCDPVFFNRDEGSKFIIDLFKKHNITSTYLRYPKRYIMECAIRNKYAIAFDAEGYMYKCWEVIGNKKYAVGKLDSEGIIKDIDHTNLNRQMYGADSLCSNTCVKCKYMPLCNGGCPIDRVENEFENRNHDTCSYYKNYMVDFLKAHLTLKKAGYENY